MKPLLTKGLYYTKKTPFLFLGLSLLISLLILRIKLFSHHHHAPIYQIKSPTPSHPPLHLVNVAKLYFQPPSSVKVGHSLQIPIFLDTNTHKMPDLEGVRGVDFVIKFNPHYLILKNIIPQKQNCFANKIHHPCFRTFTPLNKNKQFDYKKIILCANQGNTPTCKQGLIQFSALTFDAVNNQLTPALQGNHLKVATLIFSPRQQGTTSLNFVVNKLDSVQDTNVVGQSNNLVDDILLSAPPTTLTISQ